MATKLDGPGTAKMSALEEAQTQVQHIHGLIERMAMAVKNGQNSSATQAQIRRAASPLVGKLKSQFAAISDLIASMLLSGTRGAEQQRVRAFREGIAQVRAQIDIAATKVREQHTVTAGAEAREEV